MWQGLVKENPTYADFINLRPIDPRPDNYKQFVEDSRKCGINLDYAEQLVLWCSQSKPGSPFARLQLSAEELVDLQEYLREMVVEEIKP